MEIHCPPYEFMSALSTDRSNKVYKVKSKVEKIFVLKTFASPAERQREAEMLIKAACPHVIELMDDIHSGLILEFMETDAYAYFQLIRQAQPNLVNLKVKELLLQTILPGLEYLHKSNICHGDLKCGNILGKQTFPGCLVWKISDFDHAAYFDDPIDPGTYLPPEVVVRMKMGKKMPASYGIDVFALGMMIAEIFSGFTYYQEQCDGAEYCDLEKELQLPPSIPPSFIEKLSLMLSKDRTKRITVSKFAQSQLFKDLSTAQKSQIGIENMSHRFDVLTMQITKDSHKLDNIKNQLEDMSDKLDEINKKLDQFLPAIQQNLLDIMATEAVPGKFVMFPVKSSFIRKALTKFYTKYDIWFFCEDDSGAHLVKHDHGDEKKKKGFEFFEVTAFGEAAMFICKCLLMLAIKQLTGLSFLVAGAQVDLTQLRSSLTAVNTEILSYDVDTLSKFKIDSNADWDAISRQVMPSLKSFLSTKDKSLMGVKPSNDTSGRQRWLCDFHYKSTVVAGVTNPPTYNSSNRQNASIPSTAPSQDSVPPKEDVLNTLSHKHSEKPLPVPPTGVSTAEPRQSSFDRTFASDEKAFQTFSLPTVPESGSGSVGQPITPSLLKSSTGDYPTFPRPGTDDLDTFSFPTVPESGSGSVGQPITPSLLKPSTGEYSSFPRPGTEGLETFPLQTVPESGSGFVGQAIPPLLLKPSTGNYPTFPRPGNDGGAPVGNELGYAPKPTMSTIPIYGNIVVPVTEAPKINYNNPYLVDDSGASDSLSKTDYSAGGRHPQLGRGATSTGIGYYPGGPTSGLGRSATVIGGPGLNSFAQQQQRNYNDSLPAYSMGTSPTFQSPPAEYNAYQHPNYQSYPNPPQNIQYQSVGSPSNYPIHALHQPSPTQTFPNPYYGPITLNPTYPSQSDNESNRSTSPMPFNPLLPHTFQKFNPN